jgi:glycosyltransferase involved in cell wall biosynthesis
LEIDSAANLVLLPSQYFADLKVLILAYDFPPLISIGGQRPYSWYKYLPQSGIDVTIVTRHWSDKISSPSDYVKPTAREVRRETDAASTIIRVPFSPNLRDRVLLKFGFEKFVRARKLLTYFYAYLEHLFFFFDSKSAIYREAKKAIEQNKPDIIIATGEPFILFKYGHFLAAKYDIPWIADYRDGWTSNQGNYESGNLKRLLDNFYRNREKLYTSNARLIATASPTYAEALHKIHPDKEIKVVYNGFDGEFFQGLDKIHPPHEKFIISYAGTIYPHQNLEMFLDGLKGDMEVLFYGLNSQPAAQQRLFVYCPELRNFLKSEPRIEYSGLIKKLRSSHLLLLLSKKGADWLNAKIFDYMGVRRPVILVENDAGVLEKILTEMNAGKALNSPEEVASFLQTAYAAFKRNDLPDTNLNQGYLKYSRSQQTMEFAQVLKSLNVNA